MAALRRLAQAIPVEGGYRLSGHWTFASGSHHISWFICGALVIENGAPHMSPEGGPMMYLMFVPASEVKIIDTWLTGGLRGTGSNDLEVSNVFVPERRRFAFSELLAGPQPKSELSRSQSFMLLIAPGMAAVALGIARDAIDSLKQLAQVKTPTGASSKLLTQPAVHERIGTAEAVLGSARCYLLDAVARLDATPHPGDDLSALVRLASAHAVRASCQAVDLMYGLGGSNSVYTVNRLDRCFRDVHTVGHHVLVSHSIMEMVGQYYWASPGRCVASTLNSV
ncbi:MAG TPA: acyl-CoA dehydrogenase family protein [Dehalococcoidia bacterium]|nr:acyl-CoA dehydrogenase family protein [Dehalococcoidia bacterium]